MDAYDSSGRTVLAGEGMTQMEAAVTAFVPVAAQCSAGMTMHWRGKRLPLQNGRRVTVPP